ncbi:hypothetical protein GTA08_BOTSDO11323 [Neofusicoccum parvum]|uniref:Uncharacterized protein n=1 Tax=Neofusicoccum parvum TaxID=310453 RepID=A0ACB5RYY5_9PEZI|nr:hypothetical protein GTA08_BOTSDO11323 [Neofusicoccum parvum]
MLGYNDTYHMISASTENPPDCLMWSDALAAKYDNDGHFGREQWDQLLGHCQAVCDWPAVAFARELIEAYPEAKVILTTRDVDSWYKWVHHPPPPSPSLTTNSQSSSCLKTVHWRATEPELARLARHDWAASLYHPMLATFWRRFFRGGFEKHGKAVFADHYAEVRALVPPDRLLEYRVGEGWERLCAFLDVPVPRDEFPNVNDTSGFVSRCRRRMRAQWCNVALRWAVYGTSAVAVGAVVAAAAARRVARW